MKHSGAVPPSFDQPGIPQNCEMLGDIRHRNMHDPCNITNRHFFVAQRVKNKETFGISQCLKDRFARFILLYSHRMIHFVYLF